MAFDDKQPIGQSILYDAAGNPVSVINDAGTFRVAVDAAFTGSISTVPFTDDCVGLTYQVDDQSSDVDLLFLDVSNSSGAYKHPVGTQVKVIQLLGKLTKSVAGREWNAILKVVLAIDGTNATLAHLDMTALHLEDSQELQTEVSWNTAPCVYDITVSAGDFTKLAASRKEVDANINTGITLTDVGGNAVAPAVGDIILSIRKSAGGGTADAHYSMVYLVE